MKDLKISSLLTLTTALMLSATCIVASDSEDGETPLASSYQANGLLAAAQQPAVDEDDMGPHKNLTFLAQKKNL